MASSASRITLGLSERSRTGGLRNATNKGLGDEILSSEKDVIIVGAGAAGLSAAKELTRLGLSYHILEGSHRIGGRAYSEEIAPGEWFDLGCAWLVGGDSNPFVAKAEELGLALSKDKSDRFLLSNLRFQRNGSSLSAEQQSICLSYYNNCYQAIARAAEQGQDVALCDVIDMDHAYAAPFLAAIGTAWGMDVDQVSTLDHSTATGELGHQAYGGYGNLIAAWGRDVPVALNCRAEGIDWSGRGVSLATPKGELAARCALLTVSTGVLASGDITFVPELPEWKSEAIHNLPMGTENKVGVHFDRDVFGDGGRAYYTTWNDDGLAAKVDASIMGLNTASVFVGGRLGVWLEKQGPRALADFAIDRVAEIFGNSLRKHVMRCITTAWESEPWTRGSWACARPGHADKRAQLASPIDRRLFFAGEATLYGGQGTCSGAYESGLRAAHEISEALMGAGAKAAYGR